MRPWRSTQLRVLLLRRVLFQALCSIAAHVHCVCERLFRARAGSPPWPSPEAACSGKDHDERRGLCRARAGSSPGRARQRPVSVKQMLCGGACAGPGPVPPPWPSPEAACSGKEHDMWRGLCRDRAESTPGRARKRLALVEKTMCGVACAGPGPSPPLAGPGHGLFW